MAASASSDSSSSSSSESQEHSSSGGRHQHHENMSSSSSTNDDEEEEQDLSEKQPPQPQPKSSRNHHNHNNSTNNRHQNNVNMMMTKNVMKKVRVAKAQAEIDRILQGPDATIIDTEAELEKVVSMSLIPSDQPLLDAEMARLESELYQAVKQQDFTLASTKKAQLLGALSSSSSSAPPSNQQNHDTKNQQQTGDDKDDESNKNDNAAVIDDGGAILQVNAAFYRAFSQKSWTAMDEVWLRHDDPGATVCIHPSHKPLLGARRISKSWKQMFASADGSFQRNWMEPHRMSIMMKGSHMAIVTCEEHVFARRFVRGKKRQTELINKLLATNIFRKVGSKWYMCYHHASWHPDSDAAKRALMTGGGVGGAGGGGGRRLVSKSNYYDTEGSSLSSSSSSSSLAAALAAQRRRRRRQLEDDEDEEYEETIGMDGILGNKFGPILGDEKKTNNNNNNNNNDMNNIIGSSNDGKPYKRIIMGGSLSDLLNGGLGDILGASSSSSGGDKINNNGMDKINNNGLPPEGAILQFQRGIIGGEDDDDEDDEDDDDLDYDLDEDEDDDDEEEDGDDDEDEEGHEGESVAIIKEWASSAKQRLKETNDASTSTPTTSQDGSQMNDNKVANTRTNASSGSSTTTTTGSTKGGLFKDALRQNCISALRKLCDQGSISPKQKRVLLTDIITCSSRGDFSMVEVAYDLLLAEQQCDNDDAADQEGDAAEEEFAEQCRVFAQERLKKEDV